VAYGVLKDHQLAEDAAQEAFARGLVSLHRLKEPGRFAPWLVRICRNVAVDHTVKGSSRYLGNGVPLGDQDRIVCWYKLKGAGVYRVVYADLSIRNAAPEDLPLPVEP